MAEPLITHLVTSEPADPSAKLRDSIGGHPYLPVGTDWPFCSCGERMSLYFQFDIREEFGLPLQIGSHLAIFQCEAMSGYVPARLPIPTRGKGRLKKEFWERNHADPGPGRKDKDEPRFYRVMLNRPDAEHDFHSIERIIAPQSLSFRKVEERYGRGPIIPDGEDLDFQAEPEFPGASLKLWKHRDRIGRHQDGRGDFKIGGQPNWPFNTNVYRYQSDRSQGVIRCACGESLVFVCQIPLCPSNQYQGAEFLNMKNDGNTMSLLFNGLHVLFLACRAQCHPFAVAVIVGK